MTALAPTLQAFFTERLIRQRQASPHTLAAYRDTLRLLLVFASARKDVEPSKLDIDDLDAPLIGAFLDHLEKQRENSARTRNARLAAVRSLFRYAALRHPEHAAVIERVLAIPRKRFDRRLVTFLIEPELDALFRAPDRSTWTGRRDHTLLTLAAQTGLRASELIGLRLSDVHLGTGAHVSCMGKGRKLRITPITSGMVALLRVWLAERAGQPAGRRKNHRRHKRCVDTSRGVVSARSVYPPSGRRYGRAYAQRTHFVLPLQRRRFLLQHSRRR
jgi:integrase/recombinase XerD